jgi:photosystem II stability/assembly factor-like uncharacterized protein
MMRFVALLLVLVCAAGAQAATCPFDIPVVTIAPHSAGGFSWGTVIRPLGDPCVERIAIDPSNNVAWYAAGPNGLYMTKNSGQTWTKPLSGNITVLHLVESQPQLVYAAMGNKLYLTRDSGTNWTLIRTFPVSIASLLVSGGTLYVGPAGSPDPSGIYVSSLGAGTVTFKPFGPGYTGVLVWTISRDPITGTLYAGGEIYNHPQPYDPPFFRSNDNGNSWTEISGTMPWHVIDSAVRSPDGYVYALTEGLGVYGSTNQGATWTGPISSPGLGGTLLMDPKTPTRLFAGRQKFGSLDGGIFMSTNAGATFQSGGLLGVTISDIALNSFGSRIYAVAYGSGIYVSSTP